MWNNRWKVSTLGMNLFVRVAIAGLFSLLTFWILMKAEMYYLENFYYTETKYRELVQETTESLQHYITEGKIHIGDMQAIRTWDRENSALDIRLIRNNRVIYDSLDYMNREASKIVAVYYDGGENLDNTLYFPEGSAVLSASINYKQQMEKRLDYIIIGVCVLLFCILILREFSKMVRDIVHIEKGIHILESGDLTYRIHVNRAGELKSLADSINRMSHEIDRHNQEEERLHQKNYDLVTSVSHDIRTPLTSVISYADLLSRDENLNQKQLGYMEKIKDRAYLIKDLTDNLFLSFINRKEQEEERMEIITGNDFISYLLYNMQEDLKARGFLIRTEFEETEEFFLKADVLQVSRVFNNLEGNLIKYAKKECEITYCAFLECDKIIIEGKNAIVGNRIVESHGVGMRNCQNILHLHKGEMEAYVEKEGFFVRLWLPVLTEV